MIPEKITQENFRILLPTKIAQTVALIAEDTHASQEQTLVEFYLSPFYRELETEETKRWWDSPLQLCRGYEARKNS
jgi:hypothetical protein